MNTIATIPISNEARGRTRKLLASLEVDAAKLTKALARLPPRHRDPSTWNGRSGARLAIARIIAALRPPDHVTKYRAVWRFCQPMATLPSARGANGEPPRAGIMVMAIVAQRLGYPVQPQPFGLAVTSHAISRCLDRSNFEVDPVGAIFSAHNCLLALPPAAGEQVFELADVTLATPGGAFLCTPCRIGRDAPLAVARTWISRGQTFPDQDTNLALWATLLGRAT